MLSSIRWTPFTDVWLNRKLEGEIDCAPAARVEAPVALGEAPALDRAVTNLLDNAAKWSPDGGHVTVRLSDGVLTVDDEGPGIPPEERERIFDRFWRSADSRTLPGSGLGLAIVRKVAERHAGTVQAAENVGGGARLVLKLPGTEKVDA